MVNVYETEDHDGDVIARVTYNDKLDRWDGSNFGNGGTGMHKGITRLSKTGRMVIIIGTQWQGSRDAAHIVSDRTAITEILQAGKPEIIAEYPQLAKLYAEMETD